MLCLFFSGLFPSSFVYYERQWEAKVRCHAHCSHPPTSEGVHASQRSRGVLTSPGSLLSRGRRRGPGPLPHEALCTCGAFSKWGDLLPGRTWALGYIATPLPHAPWVQRGHLVPLFFPLFPNRITGGQWAQSLKGLCIRGSVWIRCFLFPQWSPFSQKEALRSRGISLRIIDGSYTLLILWASLGKRKILHTGYEDIFKIITNAVLFSNYRNGPHAHSIIFCKCRKHRRRR